MKEPSCRFFFHFNKKERKMTVHYKGKCMIVKDIVCTVPVETKYNKRQPFLVIQGFSKGVYLDQDKLYIN